ncbi:glycerol-3-phosphate dehydrogenase subunit GlpB [Halobaculum sp. MBLA0143]|uniref:glycerol-3-phosphate dehydrogenase subunit GlpB n=1 Tax=Halobaculum sp. MBLA0143 TaxID=3079933 RepID=UPI003525C73E
MAISSEVLVVGGGLAGVTAALSAARAGADVRLVSHKASTLRQASGLIDALGYVPSASAADADDDEGPLQSPYDGIDRLRADHPLSVVGSDALRAGLSTFDDATGDSYRGEHTDRNALVPTVGGTVKPTARYPASVAAGLASDARPTLIVGLRSLTGYDARVVADGLRASGVPFPVAGAEVSFAADFAVDASLTRLATALDRDEPLEDGDGAATPAREALAAAVAPHLDDAGGPGASAARVGLPAFLGDDHPEAVRTELAERLGVDVFEVPGTPPSLPGMRLEDRLYEALDEAGVRFETGNPVVGTVTDTGGDDGRVDHVLVERKNQRVPYAAESYVLATGGLVGKGVDSDREAVREPAFGCHVPHPDDRYDWFVDEPLGDQPYARFGVATDDRLRPLAADETVQYPNVHVAGATLGGADVAREKAASGVSLATGYAAGEFAADATEQST